jgi:hypothetical protein
MQGKGSLRIGNGEQGKGVPKILFLPLYFSFIYFLPKLFKLPARSICIRYLTAIESEKKLRLSTQNQ